MARVFIYSHDLKTFYGELICRTVRAWTLNAPLDQLPTATVYVATADPELTQEMLRYRNVLYITDGILPDWAGQIGEPSGRGYTETRITATAYETVLDDRYPLNNVKTTTPGVIFESLINDANAVEPLGIDLADVEDLDRPISFSRGSLSTLQAMQWLQRKTKFQWGITPTLPEGQPPRFDAWFRQTAGYDWTGDVNRLELIEDINIECEPSGDVIVTNGRVKNDVKVVASSGSTDNAFEAFAFDIESASLYGIAQYVTAENAKSKDIAQQRADRELAQRLKPGDRPAVTVNDPAIFPYLILGSRYPLYLPRLNWEGDVELIGMAYDDLANKVECVVEVI